MHDNIHDLSKARPGRSASASRPVSAQEAVAQLTSCLCLVRPVGMTEQEAEDWLSVALGEVLHYPRSVFVTAAAHARRTCTHHAQIVPAIIRHCEEAAPSADPLVKAVAGVPAYSPGTALPAPAKRRLTQADVDSMSPELIGIGLICGALVRDGDGNVILNPE